eukprot:359455_1
MGRIQERLDEFVSLYSRKRLRTTKRAPLDMFTNDERYSTHDSNLAYEIEMDEMETNVPTYINSIQVPTKLEVPPQIVSEIVSQIPWDRFNRDSDGMGLWQIAVRLTNERVEIQYDGN